MRRTVKRRDDPAAELGRLDEAIVRAEAELTAAEAEVQASEALEAELGELSADEYLGNVAPHEYERRRAEVEERRRSADRARERAETVVSTLRARAADLAEQIAARHEAEAEQALRAAEEEVARYAATLADAERRRDEAADTLLDAHHASVDARAAYDREAAEAAGARARQESETVRWHAQHKPTRPDEWPRHLRAEIAETVERLRQEADEARARREEEAWRSREEVGTGLGDALR